MSSHRAAVAPPMTSAVRAACAMVRLDDRHVANALRLHVLRGELAHFAGADHDDGAAVEAAENLAREGSRGVADRHGPRAQAGFRAHALADGKRGVEQAIEQRSGGVGVPGGAVRLFHLAEHLGFAHDERVEPGRDAKQVAGRFEIGDLVDVRLDRRHLDAVKRADKRHQVGSRRRDVLAGDVQLGPVARREHRYLAARARLARARRVSAACARGRAPENRRVRAARWARSGD